MKKTAPKVSIIMPCLNEERFIGRAIESLVGSESIRSHFLDWELIVVDGGSTDRTREVVREYVDGAKAKELGIGGRVRLIDNPGRLQSHGLNAGIKEARGEIIVRADAHCIFPPGYVRRCVELLEKTGAANVGGVMVPVVEGVDDRNKGIDEGNKSEKREKKIESKGKKKYVQKAIALALRHPVGVGDARWHLGNYTGFVDTVYLGTFRREVFDEVGLYDTNLKANEDGELNLRILKAGKKIYLDNSIRVAYFPRETLGKLAKQYFHYGKGRCYTTLKHRRVTSWRPVGPVGLVVGFAGAVAVGFVWPWALLLPAAYLVALLAAAVLGKEKIDIKSDGKGKKSEKGEEEDEEMGGGEEAKESFRVARNNSLSVRLLMAAAFAVMHVSWGVGFISRLVKK